MFANISLLMAIDELPQKIDPEGWSLDLKPGFGYTISKVDSNKKLDVDGNKCNDFAVGYPQSNKVVLLRSKEVVMLQAKQNNEGIKLNFTFLDFSFKIEATLSILTKGDQRTSWPLKAKLQIAEQAGKRLQMKYQDSGWQDLPHTVTISNIKYDGNEFKRDKIKIELRYLVAGENFGKKDDAELVDPIKIKFTSFWELDHANKPTNTGVGAVLENLNEPTWKEAVIKVA